MFSGRLYLVEDCAQSHGAAYNGQATGTCGDVGCFSFYPTKNLGAFGDGGAVVCASDELERKFRIYRNYGSQEHYKNIVVGANSRLDEIQAALLSGEGSFPITEHYADTVLSIPMYNGYTQEEQEYVIKALNVTFHTHARFGHDNTPMLQH